MDRRASRARTPGRPNSHSLRYDLAAPGPAAWGGLPERDRALLRWLLVGDVVTSELAAVLAYGSLRTARRRLARMVELGLLRGFWAANSQRPRGRHGYALVRSIRDELTPTATLGRRAASNGSATASIHLLATNDLIAAFLREADPERGLGLTAWLTERSVAPLFDGYVRPDALAVIATPSSRIPIFIERDLGTETARIVAAKVARYATVLASRTEPSANLGIVADSARRVTSIQRAVGVDRPDVPVWIAAADNVLAAPYDADWVAGDGRRRRTIQLPAEPRSDHVEPLGALCLLDPDAAEAFDASAIRLVKGLQRFARGP
jgi:protein involved in plasmid replication-relaxation